MNTMVSEKDFKSKILPEIPEEHRERALKLFNDYGEYVSGYVVEALCAGLENNKLPYVFTELDVYYEKKVKMRDDDLRFIMSENGDFAEYFIFLFGRITGNGPIVRIGLG
jgi:hypothetical protein